MAQSAGLYGSNTAAKISKVFVAELIGTYFLVLVGTSVAVSATLGRSVAGSPFDSLAVALGFGLALIALVFTLGHISGAHLNPAVTLGLAITGKFPWRYSLYYIFAQCIGGVLASFTVLYMFGAASRTALLGAAHPASGIGGVQVFVIEAIATFFLMLVIMAIATDSRTPKAAAGTAIGFTLAAGIMLAGPITGGALNPARALAPMFVSAHWASWFAYLIGPTAGAVLAAIVYDTFLSETDEPQKSEDE